MIREKPCNFSGGLCFEKHSHYLVLQKRMSASNALNGSFLTIHPEHIIEEAVLQKSRTANLGKELQADRDILASFVIDL